MLLSQAIQVGYLAGIVLLLAGDHIFPLLNIPPPQIYRDAQANKMAWIFGLYFFGNTISNSLMNSGAFEVYVDGELVWSKLATGRLPSWEELLEVLHAADPATFPRH
eukprot:m.142083 g.142083  ORF g.142083 m.142083 type:complete len:107 (+) comp14966_c1_seq3:2587-2907(+)